MLGGHYPNARQNGTGSANLEADAELHCTPQDAGTLGPTWTHTNNIRQECSLSLLATAALSTVWARVLEEEVLAVLCNSIVDDRRLCATGKTAPTLLHSAMQITRDCDRATGTRFIQPTEIKLRDANHTDGERCATNCGTVWNENRKL